MENTPYKRGAGENTPQNILVPHLSSMSPHRKKVPETLEHALFRCSGNNSLPQLLLTLLCSYTPNVTPERVLTLDLNIESHMELPLLWIIASVLSSMLAQRQEGRVCLAKTRAQLEAKCRLLREGKGASLQNAFTLTSIAIQAMFAS